jgi:TetR/AcrR family transcriptional regulator, cholesterol catabolism regulator
MMSNGESSTSIPRIESEMRTYSEDEALVASRRASIAKCAIDIFALNGYERTTLRDVAKACGMAKGSLYHYVGSKQDILYLVMRYIMEDFSNLADSLSVMVSGIGPQESLRIVIRKYYEYLDANRARILFLYRETTSLEPEYRKAVFQMIRHNIDLFQKILDRGMESGEFDPANSHVTAQTVMVIGDNWALWHWLLDKYCSLDEYIEQQTDLILKSVSKQ